MAVGPVAQAFGLRIPGGDGGVGGRIPDFILWCEPQTRGIWLPVKDVLMVIEIISPGSEANKDNPGRLVAMVAGRLRRGPQPRRAGGSRRQVD